MPLRDHFHPPLENEGSWEGFHGAWPTMIVIALGRRLVAAVEIVSPANKAHRPAAVEYLSSGSLFQRGITWPGSFLPSPDCWKPLGLLA